MSLGDLDRLLEVPLGGAEVADLAEHRPEGDPGPCLAERSPCRRNARQAASSIATAPTTSPCQYRTDPAVVQRPGLLGAGEARLGGVQEFQGAVEVAEPTDDERQGHLNPAASCASPAASARSTPERNSAAAVEVAELALGDSDHPLQAGTVGIVGQLQPSPSTLPRRTPTGSASTWSSSSEDGQAAESAHHQVDATRGARRASAAKYACARRAASSQSAMPTIDPPAPSARPPSSAIIRRRSATLAKIFDRRRIAVGLDSSVTCRARPTRQPARRRRQPAQQRQSLRATCERYDEEQADAIREHGDGTAQRFETVRLRDVERETINGEERWTLRRVQSPCVELAALDSAVRGRAQPRHPRRAGGHRQSARSTGHLGWRDRLRRHRRRDEVRQNGVVRKVLLSTAEPAEAPRVPASRGLNIRGAAGRSTRPRHRTAHRRRERRAAAGARVPRAAASSTATGGLGRRRSAIPSTTRTSPTTTAPEHSTSRPVTARSSAGSFARSAPTPRSTRWRALELRRW